MCHARADQMPAGSGRGGSLQGVSERWLCRADIPISIVVRGHFIVVTAAPDFRGARPARRVFIGRRASHGQRHVRRRSEHILHTYMDACTPVAASRCQGIRRVIHTWNINRSPTRPSLLWYATTPRTHARTLSFFACSRFPHHVQRRCANYIHLYHACVMYM